MGKHGMNNHGGATQYGSAAMDNGNSNNAFKNLPDPDTLVSVADQKQYKIQLLLHINSVLLARVIHLTNTPHNSQSGMAEGATLTVPEPLQALISQNLKRVHANLQCISQINQGVARAKPIILDPPDTPTQASNTGGTTGPPQDILAKLYILMARVFEFW